MNKLTDYILEPGNQLYRYDIVQPPKEWSTVFKNPEYVYPDTGIKNQIDAFFFFNSIFFAIETGRCALEKERKKGYPYQGLWITKCKINTSIKLSDLRDSIICIELLAALDKAGFAFFVDKLNSWQGISFSKLKPIIQPVEDLVLNDINPVNNEEVRNAIKEMHDVLKIEMTNIGHLLQMFTDYSNGYYFRKLLQEKGYEGYIFNETNCPIPIVGSDTICIFKSTKFLPPCVEAIYTEKEAEAS